MRSWPSRRHRSPATDAHPRVVEGLRHHRHGDGWDRRVDRDHRVCRWLGRDRQRRRFHEGRRVVQGRHDRYRVRPTLDFSTTTGLVGEAVVIVFSGTLGAWETPSFAAGEWLLSAGPGTEAANSTIDVPSGGAVVLLIGIRDDSATFTRPTVGIDEWRRHMERRLCRVTGHSCLDHDRQRHGRRRGLSAGHHGCRGRRRCTARLPALTAAETGAMLWIVINDVAAAAPVSRNTRHIPNC